MNLTRRWPGSEPGALSGELKRLNVFAGSIFTKPRHNFRVISPTTFRPKTAVSVLKTRRYSPCEAPGKVGVASGEAAEPCGSASRPFCSWLAVCALQPECISFLPANHAKKVAISSDFGIFSYFLFFPLRLIVCFIQLRVQ